MYKKLCTLTNQNEAYVSLRHRYIRYFLDQYWSTTHQSPFLTLTSNYAAFSMAERTRDGGVVEECKGFSSLNVPTTNTSLNRLPLGSLDLNTRAPNTGTATPQRLRRTEPQRSAGLAKKGARYTQRTEGQRLMHNAHKIITSNT